MHRLLGLLIILNLFGSSLFAQERPLPIEQVRPLIDSVQMEINRMYRLSVSGKKALGLAKNQQEGNNRINNQLTYIHKDTTVVLLLDSNQKVLMTVYFRGEENELLKTKQIVRALSKEESIQFQAKQKALEEAQKKQYAIQAPEECAMEYIFHPNRSGHTLHVLAIPLVDSILPTGHNHHFLFDYQMNVLRYSQTKKLKVHSIRKKDNPPKSTLISVSAPIHQKSNDFKILIPYFYKYRIYHQNLGLTQYGASINKRSLTYDADKNKISIKLFPAEE
ncbi:MAG: hypothetical protein WD530_00800 [Vicingaceae bacterium]